MKRIAKISLKILAVIIVALIGLYMAYYAPILPDGYNRATVFWGFAPMALIPSIILTLGLFKLWEKKEK